jgi:hypothetical protein
MVINVCLMKLVADQIGLDNQEVLENEGRTKKL